MTFFGLVNFVGTTLGINVALWKLKPVFQSIIYRSRRIVEYQVLSRDRSANDAAVWVGKMQVDSAICIGLCLCMTLMGLWSVAAPPKTFLLAFMRPMLQTEAVVGMLLFFAMFIGAMNALDNAFRERFPRKMIDEQLEARGYVDPINLRQRRDDKRASGE